MTHMNGPHSQRATAYRCPQDGTRAPVEAGAPWCCPACGGPWDLDFTAGAVELKSLAGRVGSLWRYAEALPLDGPPPVTLGEGRTPLVPLTGTVSAKLDFLMPTLSFKDRGAVMLAELARRLAPERVIADSSGNAGTSFAAYMARAGLPCTVYVPEATSPKKVEQIGAHGARVERVPGDREATARAARAAADTPGTFYASHVFNPYFLHGTKTYVYELWEDLGGQAARRARRPGRQRHPAARRRTGHGGTARTRPDPRTPRTDRGPGGGGVTAGEGVSGGGGGGGRGGRR